MKKSEENSIINVDLNLIYSYYCRLNPQKMKHKHFSDVTVKTEAMDLHEFMMFCKDVSLNAKRKKKHMQTQEDAAMDNQLAVQQLIRQTVGDYKSENIEEKQYDLEVNVSDLVANLSGSKVEGSKTNETNIIMKNKKPICKPKWYLDERKIAQVFKKYSSPEGEINYDQFYSTLKDIAEQMYKDNQPEKLTKSQKNKKKQHKMQKNQGQLPLNTKQTQKNAILLLLQFLELNTSQNLFQFYTKINQLHGGFEHLVLMRSPVKKLQIKNDPLGKYAGKQNNQHSRLIQVVNIKKKEVKKDKTLPILPKNNKNSYISNYMSSKSSKNIVKMQGIQAFLKNHQTQINLINKTYENVSKVKPEATNLNVLEGQQMIKSRIKPMQTQKKPKTYSQRHKDKIIGENTELGKLIDVSDLYNDQIFNKYLEINHSPKNSKNHSQTKLVNAKHFQYK